MNRPKVVAVIQARMTSTRLPGKVLLPLAGKPVLWHVIHRLRKCRNVDEIAIATTENAADDRLVSFAAEMGVAIVRGSEEDVLSRFLLAARELDADVVVRVCSDSPLIDPEVLDQLIDILIKEDADYCMGDPSVPTIHEGFCPVTRTALEWLGREAGEDPAAREHVTTYIHLYPEHFRIASAPVDPAHCFKGARLSVDTPADLAFLEEVHRRLQVEPGEIDVADLVTLLKQEPQLLEINAHVYQKKAYDKSHRILFRCDGHPGIGYGHVVRCLVLATELREGFGCGVTFAITPDPVSFELVSRAGFPLETQPDDQDQGSWLEGLLERCRIDALILDIRNGLSRERVESWKKDGRVVIVIDDPGELRLVADQAFYPPVKQVRALDWTGFNGELHVGWEWVVLGRQFRRRSKRVGAGGPRILVTMGGSDPAGMTLMALRAFEKCSSDFEVLCVIGPGFSHQPELEVLLGQLGRVVDVRRDVSDMAALMAEVDLAVASFGMTAYELAAMGVPAIYLCLSKDHAESAALFSEAEVAVSLGVYTQVSDSDIAAAVDALLQNKNLALMVERTGALLDGKGTERIAGSVVERLNRGGY